MSASTCEPDSDRPTLQVNINNKRLEDEPRREFEEVMFWATLRLANVHVSLEGKKDPDEMLALMVQKFEENDDGGG